MPLPHQDILIALGGNASLRNQGPKETINQSLERLQSSGLFLVALSALYRTPAFPAGSGAEFVNAAALLRSDMAPLDILRLLHNVETGFGRNRKTRWGSRTLDLDLLAVGASVLPDKQTNDYWRALPLADQMERAPETLVLPHPRIQDRAFVLVPLCDVAPDWKHPVIDRTVRQMLSDLPKPDRDAVQPL